MIIYTINNNEQFSLGEQAQMAIEGGCEWINISTAGYSDEELKETVAGDMLEMCREAGIILTIDDRPELARELGLHGVRFSASYFMTHPTESPMSLRNSLGPEAIIGIETADPSAMADMKAADIDFVCVPDRLSAEERTRFVTAVREQGCELPLVAQGDISKGNASVLIDEGFNGLAVGGADDPGTTVAEIMNALSDHI